MTVYHGDAGELVKQLRVVSDAAHNVYKQGPPTVATLAHAGLASYFKAAADCIEAQLAEIKRLRHIVAEARDAVSNEWPKHPTNEDLYGFYMMVRNAVAAYDEAAK